MVNVTELKYLGGHVLRLHLSDRRVGDVDLTDRLRGPVFEPLKDPARFAEAFIDDELGTVAWPNGADVAPEFLYDALAPIKGVAEPG